MNFDMDELVKHGWELIALDMQQLKKSGGDVGMKYVIITGKGERVIVFTDPEMANNPDLKSLLAAKIREMVAEHKAIAVMFISDIYVVRLEDKKHPEEAERISRIIHDIGTAEAERRGLCTRREALQCQIETRGAGKASLFAFYRRDQRKRRIIEEETLEERPTILEGRMANYFPVEEVHHA
jgi:hypothetical protein